VPPLVETTVKFALAATWFIGATAHRIDPCRRYTLRCADRRDLNRECLRDIARPHAETGSAPTVNMDALGLLPRDVSCRECACCLKLLK